LGIGRRSVYRDAMGETAIPQVVVKLLDGDIAGSSTKK
jgi:hypothetical protein